MSIASLKMTPMQVAFHGYNPATATFVYPSKVRQSFIFDDTKFVKNSYLINKTLYKKIGISFCVAHDLALAKSNLEAVVESIYSIMKCQKQEGGQSNEVLGNQTKIDWHLPGSSLGIKSFKDQAASAYSTGHKAPY